MSGAAVVDASAIRENSRTIGIESDLVENAKGGRVILLKKIVAGSSDLPTNCDSAISVAPVKGGVPKNEGVEVVGSPQ